MKNRFVIFICLVICNTLLAQVNFDPIFDEFEGTVYKIPARQIMKGYSLAVKDYEIITEIKLAELNIPERPDSIAFDVIPVSQGYGIIFESSVEIEQTGSYIFNLESDDGSILWIDSTLVIDNDKVHKMTLKSDTSYFEKGIYPLKIWYMQAIPDRYGLVFNAFYHSLEKSSNQKGFKEQVKEVLVFGEKSLQFQTNSSELQGEGIELLQQFAQQLIDKSTKKIQIIGHTDIVGKSDYNIQLSLDRAKKVKGIILNHLGNNEISIEIIGLGEEQPIAENETAEGRKQNRRVEIKIF